MPEFTIPALQAVTSAMFATAIEQRTEAWSTCPMAKLLWQSAGEGFGLLAASLSSVGSWEKESLLVEKPPPEVDRGEERGEGGNRIGDGDVEDEDESDEDEVIENTNPVPVAAANVPPKGEDKENESDDESVKEKGVAALSHTTLMRLSRESRRVDISVCT